VTPPHKPTATCRNSIPRTPPIPLPELLWKLKPRNHPEPPKKSRDASRYRCLTSIANPDDAFPPAAPAYTSKGPGLHGISAAIRGFLHGGYAIDITLGLRQVNEMPTAIAVGFGHLSLHCCQSFRARRGRLARGLSVQRSLPVAPWLRSSRLQCARAPASADQSVLHRLPALRILRSSAAVTAGGRARQRRSAVSVRQAVLRCTAASLWRAVFVLALPAAFLRPVPNPTVEGTHRDRALLNRSCAAPSSSVLRPSVAARPSP